MALSWYKLWQGPSHRKRANLRAPRWGNQHVLVTGVGMRSSRLKEAVASGTGMVSKVCSVSWELGKGWITPQHLTGCSQKSAGCDLGFSSKIWLSERSWAEKWHDLICVFASLCCGENRLSGTRPVSGSYLKLLDEIWSFRADFRNGDKCTYLESLWKESKTWQTHGLGIKERVETKMSLGSSFSVWGPWQFHSWDGEDVGKGRGGVLGCRRVMSLPWWLGGPWKE